MPGADAELVVIGAYPTSGKFDLFRGSRAEHAKVLASIPKVPLPASDLVFGRKERWSRRGALDIGLARLLERLTFDLRQWAAQGRALSADRGGDRRAGAWTRRTRARLRLRRSAPCRSRGGGGGRGPPMRSRRLACAPTSPRASRQTPKSARSRPTRSRVCRSVARSHPAALGRAIPQAGRDRRFIRAVPPAAEIRRPPGGE